MRLSLACVGALAMALIGCRHDPDTTHGVPASRKLRDLTTKDITALCNAHASDFAQLDDFGCVFKSLTASTKEDCQRLRAQCSSALASSTGGLVCSYADPGARGDCALSVGEVESCFNQLFSYFDALTCDKTGSSPPMPPDCFADLKTRCPSLFNGNGSASSDADAGT
jgi:hypothetical protein